MQQLRSCRTVSPGRTLPPRTASSSASGMEAALVLPYSARLLITRSGATWRQGAFRGSAGRVSRVPRHYHRKSLWHRSPEHVLSGAA
jgi:hypothetical protein